MFGAILLGLHVVHPSMTEPSEILREEHEVIEHLLHVLTAMAERVDRGQPVRPNDIQDALEVVVNFADKCHHAKEEKALFPVLTAAAPEEGRALVRRLEGDHTEGRRLVAAMRSEVIGLNAGNEDARAQFPKDATAYVGLLTRHIGDETEELLPMIDGALPVGKRAALAAEFDRIEREETGAGLHEKYEGTIHRLADVYVHGSAHIH